MASNYGEWKILESLSEGGQGHTFTCYSVADPACTVHVLKRLKNRTRIERFICEVETASKIENPYIAKIVAFDTECEKPYLVMPYYSKGTLAQLPLAEKSFLSRLNLFRKLCRGVRCAHNNKIIHRDLKPENIFISESGDPIVGDFGICHVVDGQRFTITEEAVGPFRFMAPELEDGRVDRIAPSSDVYSLGKLLYWMLTGRMFAREKHRDGNFNLATPEAPSEVHLIYELLDKMIIADADQRLPDANAVYDELNTLIRRIEMNAHAIGPNIPQDCLYCGKGQYQVIVDGEGTTIYNFGFQPIGNPYWRVIVCDYCGNTQIFRPDHIPGRVNPWKEK